MEMMPTHLMKAGEVIFNEGDIPEDGLYYICYGTVEVSRMENGQKVVLAELTDEATFGEMAIVNASPRTATVTAKTDCGLYNIRVENFQHQVEQLDPIMRGVFRIFVLQLRELLKLREAKESVNADLDEASDTGSLADGGGIKLMY